jgi:hypothetical protein
MIYKYTILRTVEVQLADIITIDAISKKNADELARKSMENDTLCPELSTDSESSFIVDSKINDVSMNEYDWD